MLLNDEIPKIDVRVLVRWLGVQGATAGLKDSKRLTVSSLVNIAQQVGVKVGSKPTRKDLIDQIVRVANKRIDRSIEDLFRMDTRSLVEYFETVGVEAEELLDLLKDLELDPGREGRRNLAQFVARELAETGRFKRIASGDGGREKEHQKD